MSQNVQTDMHALASIEDAYPMTSLQKGMLFHSEYEPESAIYHDLVSLYLQAPFDAPALRATLQQALASHPVLRTSFNLADFSEPVQLVHHTVELPLTIVDLRQHSFREQEEILAAWREAEKHLPFDWRRAPLLRFYVHRRSEYAFQFSLGVHHAVLDGWSVASLLNELFRRYQASLKQASQFIQPLLTNTFRDFVALEREALESPACREYWRKKLTDSVLTRLPRWPALQQTPPSRQIRVWPVDLSSDLSTDLQRFALELNVPFKSVLLAAHLRVLSLLSGQTDIMTGLVTNGRPEVEDGDKALGLFVNTLPFRLNLSGGTWRELVVSTFETERELMPFRWYPIAALQKMQGGQLLFETKFNFTHFHVYDELSRSGDMQVLGGNFFGETNFDFGAEFNLNPAGLELVFNFNATEFSDEQLAMIERYYVTTLQEMVAHSTERYEVSPVLTHQEQNRLVVEWNETETDYSLPRRIHELFETQVERAPDSIALSCGDESLTYEALNQRANQLAHWLRTFGVKLEEPVGLCVGRSLSMVIGVLAILKAGGAYVTLEPHAPVSRKSQLLQSAHVNLLLTQAYLKGSLPDYGGHVVEIDDERLFKAEQSANPSLPILPDSLAYIAYTSGSTGQPKGILGKHGSVVNYLAYLARTYHLSSTTIVLQLAALSFDASIRDMLGPLAFGGKVVIVTERLVQDPITLLEHIQQYAVDSLLCVVPTLLRSLIEAARITGGSYSSVDLVLASGEALYGSDCQRAREVFKEDLLVVNQYGPSECTMTSSYYLVPQHEAGRQVVLIGRPIPNAQFYILNRQGCPVPVGTVGEIYIGGAGLTRGYLGRPDLTAEKFVPHSWSKVPGSRLFRTGDQARYLPNGYIEFIGRIDHQVKIRGFRVELGEIESILSQHPAVREAVVIAREERVGEPFLVAYVVFYPEQLIGSDQLRAFLGESLPDYMLPSTFVFMNALPLMPNRKIDRRALPEPDRQRPELKQAFVAPRTLQEQTLAEIWQETLGVECVGIHDSFFDLGGDSLKAMRVTFKAKLAGFGLTVKQIFEHPTIAHLATILDGLQAIEAMQGEVVGPVDFTHIQLDFLTREKRTSNIQYWVSGPLLSIKPDHDATFLEKIAVALARHHDMLRLRVVQENSGWRQFIADPEQMIYFRQIDLSMRPELEQGDSVVMAMITQAAIDLLSTLNLAEDPLFQVILFKLSPRWPDCLLLFFHYLVSDPMTWQIVGEDLCTAYRQLSRGAEIKFPPKTTSYQYFAGRVKTYAQSAEIKQELAYWLAKPWSQISRLPRDHQQGPNNIASLASFTVGLTATETRDLRECVSQDIQIQDLLVTALALTLSRWADLDLLLMAIQTHGRMTPFKEVDLTRTAGWLAHRVPVLFELGAQPSLLGTLSVVSEQLHQLSDHSLGYAVLRYLCPDREIVQQLEALPQAEVIFNYFGEVDQALQGDAEEEPVFNLAGNIRGFLSDPQTELLSLLNIQPRIFQGQLYVEWLYSKNLYQDATIERLGQACLDNVRLLIERSRLLKGEALQPKDTGYERIHG